MVRLDAERSAVNHPTYIPEVFAEEAIETAEPKEAAAEGSGQAAQAGCGPAVPHQP
jgi:hypothetical protein